jgi:hypothetical protein
MGYLNALFWNSPTTYRKYPVRRVGAPVHCPVPARYITSEPNQPRTLPLSQYQPGTLPLTQSSCSLLY